MNKYLIDISELLRGEIGKKQNFSFDLPDIFSEKTSFQNGKVSGEISYLGEELLINFSVSEFTNKEACVRCLTECNQITSIDQAWESYSLSDASQNAFPLVIKKEADDSETLLDLEPLLLQEMQLSFRTHPLCLEDCAGLCPECGNNQNLKKCNCVPKSLQSPFDNLKSHFPSQS